MRGNSSISVAGEASNPDERWGQLDLRAFVEGDIRSSLTSLKRHCEAGEDLRAVEACWRLGNLLALRRCVNGQVKEEHAEQSAGFYIAGSVFLHRSFRFLSQTDSEALHFVTGPRVNGAFVLDEILTFKLENQSAVGVRGDLAATHNLLQGLDSFGHVFTAYFHTHPGRGPASTHPSSTDLGFQEKLERGGYPTIGGIFSRDGYLRFFSLAMKFSVDVYGRRVRKEDENVYRLT